MKPWREGGPNPHFSDPQLTGLTQKNESLFLFIILNLKRQEMVFHRKQGAFGKPQPHLVICHVLRASLGFSMTSFSKTNPSPQGRGSGLWPQLVGSQNPGRVWFRNLKDPPLATHCHGQGTPIFLSTLCFWSSPNYFDASFFACFLLPWSQKTFLQRVETKFLWHNEE